MSIARQIAKDTMGRCLRGHLSLSAAPAGSVWHHQKTLYRRYVLLGLVKNASNGAEDGKVMVRYQRLDRQPCEVESVRNVAAFMDGRFILEALP